MRKSLNTHFTFLSRSLFATHHHHHHLSHTYWPYNHDFMTCGLRREWNSRAIAHSDGKYFHWTNHHNSFKTVNYHFDIVSSRLFTFLSLSLLLWSTSEFSCEKLLIGCNWRCLCKWRWSIQAIWVRERWRWEEVSVTELNLTWKGMEKNTRKEEKGVKKEIDSFKAMPWL